MTQAIAARRDGDTFQARLFWIHAAPLLSPDSNVLRVGFENGPKGLDDLWVEYKPNKRPKNQYGTPISKEFIQCKWHVALGTYTYEDFTDPEFIGATTKSFLQRAYDALLKEADANTFVRIKFLTNWTPKRDDPLYGLIRTRTNCLDITKFFQGSTTKSGTYKLRESWKKHLGLKEEELKNLVTSLSISRALESLDELRERLDERCKTNGIIPSESGSSSVLHDDIVRQWAAQGHTVFDSEGFRNACFKENLLRPKVIPGPLFGVKSFEHSFDRLENDCIAVLDLVPEFDERLIKDESAWTDKIFPSIKGFIDSIASSGDRLRFILDAHSTLAFAVGVVLNTKSGRVIEIEQRTPQRKLWAPDDDQELSLRPDWAYTEEMTAGGGNDIAIAVSLSQDVLPKVRAYVAESLPTVGNILCFSLPGGASSQSVQSGAHAFKLAENLANKVKSIKENGGKLGIQRAHLFVAAPNTFAAYLGRSVQMIKPLTLYEYDFEQQHGGSYCPSLSL